MLSVQKLSFAYGDLRVLWDVDLEVHAGETTQLEVELERGSI